MKETILNQENIEELNAIFGLNKRRKKKKRILIWDSCLEAHSIGDYDVIPLTSSWALRQEGRAMRHCVGGYSEWCEKSLARIFSIRDLMGNRLATMSLVFRDDYWHLEQIKGFDNAEICILEVRYNEGDQAKTQLEMTDFHYIALEVLHSYRKAWAKDLLKVIFKAAKIGGKTECETKCEVN